MNASGVRSAKPLAVLLELGRSRWQPEGNGKIELMNKQKYKTALWRRRKHRVRKKVLGSPEQPRLSVFRSLRHTYVQLIDDTAGVTLIDASTLSKDFPTDDSYKGNAAAAKVGEMVARKALDVGIRRVRFDRSGYKYHGRVRAVAEAARKEGLIF